MNGSDIESILNSNGHFLEHSFRLFSLQHSFKMSAGKLSHNALGSNNFSRSILICKLSIPSIPSISSILIYHKGQLISKCLQFSPKKQTKKVNLRFYSSKVEFVRLFFGGNVGLKNSFRLFLTFSIHAICSYMKRSYKQH